jgi:hypothetical protein
MVVVVTGVVVVEEVDVVVVVSAFAYASKVAPEPRLTRTKSTTNRRIEATYNVRRTGPPSH